MKKDGHACLKGTSVAVGKLHNKIVGKNFEGKIPIMIFECIFLIKIYLIGAHRALPDVQALEDILTHPSLVSCLSHLVIHSPSMQLRK